MTHDATAAKIELLHADVTAAVITAFYRVYDALGFGFLESVYRNALAYELIDAGFKVEREKLIQVWYRGHRIGRFRADLVINECVIVECKATRFLDESDKEQTNNYLRSTEVEVAMLLHFGEKAKFHRFFTSNATKPNVRGVVA